MVMGSVSPQGGDIWIGTIDFHCEGAGTAVIQVNSLPAATNCGVSSTCYDPMPAKSITIHQYVEPCGCDVTPDSALLDEAGESVDFDDSFTGVCITPLVLTWSDDCTYADVDSAGVITESGSPIGWTEDCRVTVSDTANSLTCGAPVSIQGPPACQLKIYKAGEACCEEEIPDDPPFNRVGRRGLAMTCCETVTFCPCTDCVETPPCYVWEYEIVQWCDGLSNCYDGKPTGYDESDLSLTDEPYCDAVTLDAINCPPKLVVVEVTVTDTCNGNITDTVYVTIGRATLGLSDTHAHPETQTTDIELLLDNPDHHVKALQTDVCACDDWKCKLITDQLTCEDEDDALTCKWDADNGICLGIDNIICSACVIDEDRTPEYICSAAEVTDPDDPFYGCCRVVMFTTEPDDLIQEGDGAIARIKVNVKDELTTKDTICLYPEARKVSDRFGEYLCVCGEPGEISFWICGDIYPQDCYACESCGDGVVDIFDILEMIDIILGLQTATDCQKLHGDVPTGTPPHCGTAPEYNDCLPDGVLDIFDAMVIIDKALSKMNCCDYCMFGEVY
jgi:hypothetical protein